MMNFLLYTLLGSAIVVGWVVYNHDDSESAFTAAQPVISAKMSTNTPPKEVELARTALDEFLKACPDATKHWADVTSAEMSYTKLDNSPYYYEVELYGWQAYVGLEIKIKDGPSTLPPFTSGHTLHYELGGGKRSGVSTMKDQSLAFCGYGDNPDPGSNFLYPWPGFDFLKT